MWKSVGGRCACGKVWGVGVRVERGEVCGGRLRVGRCGGR